jgi:hypothetical protein
MHVLFGGPKLRGLTPTHYKNTAEDISLLPGWGTFTSLVQELYSLFVPIAILVVILNFVVTFTFYLPKPSQTPL